jgi:hypothetical protein
VPIDSFGIRITEELRGETQKLSDDFQVRLIRYNISEQSYRWPGDQRPSSVPTPDQCGLNYERAFVGNSPENRIDLESHLKVGDAWRQYQKDRERFDLEVQEANAERLRIGAYSAVFSAIATARTAADKWLEQLGG